jgi:hypothetical protein
MFSPLRPGTGWKVLLDVVAVDVVNFDACRSRDELAPPEAARTAAGTPRTPASTTAGTIIFRMEPPVTQLDRTAGLAGWVKAGCREDRIPNGCRWAAVSVTAV